MSTEYTFDGLNEWEKNLAQIIDRQYPEEFKQMVIDIAEQALGKAKELASDLGTDVTAVTGCLELGSYRKAGRHLLY